MTRKLGITLIADTVITFKSRKVQIVLCSVFEAGRIYMKITSA